MDFYIHKQFIKNYLNRTRQFRIEIIIFLFYVTFSLPPVQLAAAAPVRTQSYIRTVCSTLTGSL